MRQALRPGIAYLLLFATSALGTTGWLRLQLGAAPELPPAPSPPSSTLAPHAAPADVAPAPSAVTDPAIEAAARVRELARRSLQLADGDQVLEALRGMGEVATPESLEAMSYLASSSAQLRVRFAAVDTLHGLASRQGDPDGRIRTLLLSLDAPDTQTLELAQEAAAEIEAAAASTLR